MAKLTKIQAKNHLLAMDLVNSDKELSNDEKEFILNNYDPNANHLTTLAGAYFTPGSVADDFAICCDPNGKIIDLCAGIGALSYYIIKHDNIAYGNSRPHGWLTVEIESLTCVELNNEYVKVGKRIIPEANWICDSVFNENIYKNLGTFDCAIANPPFGSVHKNGDDLSWLDYISKSNFDLMVIGVATKIAYAGLFIIPFGHTAYDTRKREYIENYSYKQFSLKTGFALWPTSFDISQYKNDWNGAKPDAEIVDMERI